MPTTPVAETAQGLDTYFPILRRDSDRITEYAYLEGGGRYGQKAPAKRPRKASVKTATWKVARHVGQSARRKPGGYAYNQRHVSRM
jgi:hypothetical protein